MTDTKGEKKRPDPNALLESIQKEARGKLTIFLGAAAGVGKTYHMLEAAHERLIEGSDVVIGLIETHGRQETERLVAGLPIIPAKLLDYRGKTLKEMDIDAIIERKPQIVLVDELAHTNVPGSRHMRRYQDVEEILAAGINVYSTLNIQHIESLNDMVAQITGIIVRETVPDAILEEANQIQLIDIPPEDLIKRLKEGKVYVHGQAERALKHFFRPGNINALRELALRVTARRVDQDLHEYMRRHDIAGPWPVAERVMVCVSASPFSAQLIRAASRLAKGLQAELLAVYVEMAGSKPPGEKERDRMARNLRLAEQLGAKIIAATGQNLTDGILEAARAHNVTHIVIGKPAHSRLREILRGGAVVDKLIRNSGGINVHVIQGKPDSEEAPRIKTVPAPQNVPWLHFAGGLAMAGLVTVICWLAKSQLELVNIAMLFVLPILLSAVWWGRGPAYFTAFITILLFNFLFVPPIMSFTVNDLRYIWTFAIFPLTAFLAGGQAERLRDEAVFARQRERRTRALYEGSREIAAVVDMDSIVTVLAKKAAETLERAIFVLLPTESGQLTLRANAYPDGQEETDVFDANESAVAAWAFQHSEISGRSTETLPGAQCLYLPLITGGKTVGVIGVYVGEQPFTPEQRRMLEGWAGLAAVSIERVRLVEQARHNELLVESDRLRTALFNSVSHELRTPLATIIGSVSTLLNKEVEYSPEAKRELLENIQDGSARMERVVSNLLDTARLESGMMQLKIDWCDVEDIIGAALARFQDELKSRPIHIHTPANLPLIRGDCVLLEQVLVNLIDNALKYSTSGSEIEIAAKLNANTIEIEVSDRGVGIPSDEIHHIFDKFYRVKQPRQVSGTGLGLSICREIIEAHNGIMSVKNRSGGGAAFRIILPINFNQNEQAIEGR